MAKPWQFARYLRLAEDVIRDLRVEALGRRLQSVREDLLTLIALLRAWARGEYRDVPRKSLLVIVAGVLYFVTPIDLIPDFLVGLGFFDDVAVLTYVIGVVREEIERFRGRPLEGVPMSTAGNESADARLPAGRPGGDA